MKTKILSFRSMEKRGGGGMSPHGTKKKKSIQIFYIIHEKRSNTQTLVESTARFIRIDETVLLKMNAY